MPFSTPSQGQATIRVLFDCHTFDAGPQGTTTFLAAIINALPDAIQRTGSDPVEIYCAAHDRSAIERFLTVPFIYVPMRGGFLARNAIALPRAIKATCADVVVSQYVRPFFARARTISVIHDVLFLDYPGLFSWKYRFVRRLLFGWAARHSDLVATVSDYSRERIAHHFQVDASSITVIPNAVGEVGELSHKALEPLGRPLKLLYVSRLERRKRQDWCIRATHVLAQVGMHVELTLVGSRSGSYAAEIEAQAAAPSPAGATVRLISGISDEQLHDLYRDTDIFLFPSECEGFGIPIIEAAALGVPCVVADNTALSDLRHSYIGAAFQSDSFQDFVRAIRTVVADLPAQRIQARARAPEVRHAYRWVTVAEQMLPLFQGRIAS
ncbi:glycosyltransferase family 1 protein [Sphingomonadaceae bacterium jetA1]|jgi:glycosyltransferase involved in cell wall biosynthesis|uniref:glycosyltransferase family 4 protein n=1 Tax=Facivitalis istanbulensis TaxID=3075838 RepID=UPI00348296D7